MRYYRSSSSLVVLVLDLIYRKLHETLKLPFFFFNDGPGMT